jgi:hypothetical protein
MKLATKDDLLKHLLMRNSPSGMWFVFCDEDKYHVLPRWLWSYLDKILGIHHGKEKDDGSN